MFLESYYQRWRRSLQRNVEGWFRPSYVGEHETPASAEDENESPQTAGEQNNIEYRFASVQYAQPENDPQERLRPRVSAKYGAPRIVISVSFII